MLIVREKGIVYLAESLGENVSDKNLKFSYRDITNPHNCSLFKFKLSKVIGGICTRESTLGHPYKTICNLRGELTIEKIVNEILPLIQETTDLIGWDPSEHDKEKHPFDHFVLARGDRVFKIHKGESVIEIEADCEAVGDDYLRKMVYDASEMQGDAIDKIRNAYHEAERLFFTKSFPIAIIDTKSQKIRIYED